MDLNNCLVEFANQIRRWKNDDARSKLKIKSLERTINALSRQLQHANEKIAKHESSLKQKEVVLKQFKALLANYSSIEDKHLSVIMERDALIKELQHFRKMKHCDDELKDPDIVDDTATVNNRYLKIIQANKIQELQQRLLQQTSMIQRMNSEKVNHEKLFTKKISSMRLMHRKDIANAKIKLSKSEIKIQQQSHMIQKLSEKLSTAHKQIMILNHSKQVNSSPLVTEVISLDSEED